MANETEEREYPPELTEDDDDILDAVWNRIGAEKTEAVQTLRKVEAYLGADLSREQDS